MAVDMFMKFASDVCKGGSRDKTHPNEIDVLAWSWGVGDSGSAHVGGGAGAGKVNARDLSFPKDSLDYGRGSCEWITRKGVIHSSFGGPHDDETEESPDPCRRSLPCRRAARSRRRCRAAAADSLGAWIRLHGRLEACYGNDNTLAAKVRDLVLFMGFFRDMVRSDHPDDWTKPVTAAFLRHLEDGRGMKPASINRDPSSVRRCASWIHRRRPFLARRPRARPPRRSASSERSPAGGSGSSGPWMPRMVRMGRRAASRRWRKAVPSSSGTPHGPGSWHACHAYSCLPPLRRIGTRIQPRRHPADATALLLHRTQDRRHIDRLLPPPCAVERIVGGERGCLLPGHALPGATARAGTPPPWRGSRRWRGWPRGRGGGRRRPRPL